jgi:NAD(P)H-flavin reductase
MKQHGILASNKALESGIFELAFEWEIEAGSEKLGKLEDCKSQFPRAGQFFMIKPKRSSVFLPRPISVAGWDGRRVSFLIAKKGTGTEELADMRGGGDAELIGPLGNAWAGFLTAGEKPVALVGGGIGIAPIRAFAAELEGRWGQTPQGVNGNPPALIKAEAASRERKPAAAGGGRRPFRLYAGFRTASALAGALAGIAAEAVIATEDGSMGGKGFITDFLNPAEYSAIFACGPLPMLKAVAASCARASVPCFVSMEKRMACGVGACLGCTVKTVSGNKRCCADGPIFNAEEVIFDD